MIGSVLINDNLLGISKEDDILLFQLVKMLGNKNWRDINHFFSKVSKGAKKDFKEIKSRWDNHLDPHGTKLNWDIVEEYIFFEFRNKLGNRWAPIARIVPSKSDNDVKNHFHSNLKKMFRKLIKKKLDINCIFEKIRALYFMNYIKSKYQDIINYYDPVKNSINFDAIKENYNIEFIRNSDLITNVDDRAICDLVIEQKGSLKIVNTSINQVCLMIISDPLTIKLIDKLEEKYLSKNIKNMISFNFENEEFQTLINMVIKLHVFYNLKKSVREEGANSNKKREIENKISFKSDEFLKNKINFELNFEFPYNNSEEKKKREVEIEIINISHKADENKNYNFNNNIFDNKFSKQISNFKGKNSLLNKDKYSLLKDLASNSFIELNLENLNQNEEIRCNSYDTNRKIFKARGLDDVGKNNLSDSNDYQNIFNDNSTIINKEIIDKRDLEEYSHSKNEKKGSFSSKNFKKAKFTNKSDPKIFNHSPNLSNIFEKIEYNDIIDKFLDSKELRSLLKSKNLLKFEEDSRKTIKNNKKNSEKLEGLDSKFKNYFIQKLTNFQDEEDNHTFKYRDLNKSIKINRQSDLIKENFIGKIHNCNIFFHNKTSNVNYNNPILNLTSNYKTLPLHIKDEFQNSIPRINNLKNQYDIINNNLYCQRAGEIENSEFSNIHKYKKSNIGLDSSINILQNDNKNLNKFTNNEMYSHIKLNNINFNSIHSENQGFGQIINDFTKFKNNCYSKKEEKDASSKLSICNDDLKEKYPSVEEDNLNNTNTNYCYISNSLLDQLMNMQDTKIFLRLIEKIVVNNIVYSIFNKEHYASCSNIKFENNNDNNSSANIKTNRKEEDNIYNTNPNPNYPLYFVEDFNDFIKIKSLNMNSEKKKLVKNQEDDTFFNIYNKIKNQYNININNKLEQLNVNDDTNLDLDERVNFIIRKNDKNFVDENGNNIILNRINNSFNKSSFKNSRIYDFIDPSNYKILQDFLKFDKEKKEENFIKTYNNYHNMVTSKNFFLKSTYFDNLNQKFQANYEKIPNTIFKNLKVNNFNFHYDSKKKLLQRKKRQDIK